MTSLNPVAPEMTLGLDNPRERDVATRAAVFLGVDDRIPAILTLEDELGASSSPSSDSESTTRRRPTLRFKGDGSRAVILSEAPLTSESDNLGADFRARVAGFVFALVCEEVVGAAMWCFKVPEVDEEG